MSEKIMLILIVVFAIMSIQTPKLSRAVIYLGVFSLFCSIIYLFYKSPNIAIAEAAIGCTVSTVIYLVALKKQSSFQVYVFDDISYDLLDTIETFCELEDLHFHYIRFKPEQYKTLLQQRQYDLVIAGSNDDIVMIATGGNYKIEKLASTLAKDMRFHRNIQLYEMGDTHEMDNL